MNEDQNLDPLPDLPPELAELDRELEDLRITERSSFGPELEAELEQTWIEGPPRLRGSSPPGRAVPGVRGAVAAAVVALFFAGLAVPTARASLGEWSRHSLRFLGVMGEEPLAERPTAEVSEGTVGVAASDGNFATPEESTIRSAATDHRSGETSLAAGSDGQEPFERLAVTFPELVDRRADEKAIRRYYPDRLQRDGVGGDVELRLWVDPDGLVDKVMMRRGSGVAELDRAAMLAARDLEFVPATRNRVPVGTWVEFDMVFEPGEEARPLPTVTPMIQAQRPDGLDTDAPADDWMDDVRIPAAFESEAQELLRVSLGGGGDVRGRLGSLENILTGEPPAGVSILGWRADAAVALEEAMGHDSDNPVPYLALARIRKKQGLRAEARDLLERGIRRADASERPVSPSLVAALNRELGRVLEERWLPWRTLGRLDPSVQLPSRCRPGGVGAGDPTGAEALITANHLCPAELHRILAESFRPVPGDRDYRADMLAAYRAAVEAYPGQVESNVEILLDMADQEQWFEMLNEARRFAWSSRGHPYALLLSGLALQRMGRSEEALGDYALAFRGLPEDEVRDIEELAPLLDRESAEEMEEMEEEEREEALESFWRALDPILSTEVNERRVEHLARGTYAHLRYGGTRTDAGEVWVRYGRPTTVRTLGEGSGLRTEFWDYGRGPDITFQRPAVTGDMDLTPEGRTYIEDLRHLLPHWYGTRSRSVFTLPAQLGRFRGPEAGSMELEIHTRVPAMLATGAADTLELGLFLLGAGGERLSETRRSLPARPSTVRLQPPTALGVERVVVEFYHPRITQAAALRSPVLRGLTADEDPRVSDLLLVEPVDAPSRDVSRRDARIDPRTDPRDASGESVGLLFELYDLHDSGGEYAVTVEMRAEGSHQSMAVPSRPSGETEFAERWPRRAVGGATRVTEYLTADLSAVDVGEYELTVVVELPDGRPPVRLSRSVRRR